MVRRIKAGQKAFDQARVAPFLVGMKRSDVISGPLLQFQSVICEKADVLKLLTNINSSLDKEALDYSRLKEAFDVWWPRLEGNLKKIEASPDEANVRREPAPDKREIIVEEMLELLRQQQRVLNNPEVLLPQQYLEKVFGSRVVVSSGRGVELHEYAPYKELVELIVELNRLVTEPEPDMEIIRSKVKALRQPIVYLLDPRWAGTRRLWDRLMGPA